MHGLLEPGHVPGWRRGRALTARRGRLLARHVIALSSALLLFACAAARPQASSPASGEPTTATAESAPSRIAAPPPGYSAAGEAPQPRPSPAPASTPMRPRPSPAPASTPMRPRPSQPVSHPPAGPTSPTPVPAGKRAPLLVYTANLTLAVFEASTAIDKVEKLAKERGGYLVRRTDNFVTVRVPARKFRGALDAIANIGDVLHRDVAARDVTAQFRDLGTQLKNYEAVRNRLQQLLARAHNVAEALQVERQLERVTGQIEHIKGELKLLRELIAYSTINVSFQARAIEQVSATVKLPFRWLDDLGLKRLLDLEAR